MLVTTAQRPQLFGMLASLQELTQKDLLTILIDNNLLTGSLLRYPAGNTVEFYHRGVRINSSEPFHETFSLPTQNRSRSSNFMNLRDIERYARSVLTCRVRIIVELSGPSGHWGHAARNMYRDAVLDAGGDFVWHVDDDNFVLPGAVGRIKTTCNGN